MSDQISSPYSTHAHAEKTDPIRKIRKGWTDGRVRLDWISNVSRPSTRRRASTAMTATTTSTRPWERDGSIDLESFDDILAERAMAWTREADEDAGTTPSTRTTRDPIEADEDGFIRELCARWPGRARSIESLLPGADDRKLGSGLPVARVRGCAR